MDINLLKTYLEVARTRHFGHAANNLCVTQSAVSARIKLLESLLGIDLFSRGRNNITLTAAGERLRRHAETVVRGWERAQLEIAADPDSSIAFSLGATPDLWKIHGANWSDKLLAKQEIALRVELLSARHLLERLAEGALDAVLITTPRHDAGLDSRHLFDYRLRAYASRADAQLEEAMDRGEYILIDWGADFLSRHAERFGHIPPPRRQINSGIAALDLLAARGGCAYIAEPMAKDWLASSQLHPLAEAPAFEQSIYLVFRASLADRTDLRPIIGTD